MVRKRYDHNTQTNPWYNNIIFDHHGSHDRFKAVLLLWIIYCYLCFTFVFIMLSCLVIEALRSPAWKSLSSWLSYVFVTLNWLPKCNKKKKTLSDLFCSRIHLYALLSPYLCCISFFFILETFKEMLGIFHANPTSLLRVRLVP